MTIEYRGKSEDLNYRCADICYNEDKEEEKAMKLVGELENNGYECYCDEEIISVIVEDKEEYNELVKLYKALKKILKLK